MPSKRYLLMKLFKVDNNYNMSVFLRHIAALFRHVPYTYVTQKELYLAVKYISY